MTLAGELDMSTEPALTRALLQEIGTAGTTAVLADLDAVTFIDSSVINVLISARRAAHDAGRRFSITHARGHVRRVLDVTGVLATLADEPGTH